jgi:large subunit ribosomal protein L15
VNVEALNIFESGTVISKASLFEKNLVKRVGGVIPGIKILGRGELTKKLIITECLVSETAKAKIEKAGGEIK